MRILSLQRTSKTNLFYVYFHYVGLERHCLMYEVEIPVVSG